MHSSGRSSGLPATRAAATNDPCPKPLTQVNTYERAGLLQNPGSDATKKSPECLINAIIHRSVQPVPGSQCCHSRMRARPWQPEARRLFDHRLPFCLIWASRENPQALGIPPSRRTIHRLPLRALTEIASPTTNRVSWDPKRCGQGFIQRALTQPSCRPLHASSETEASRCSDLIGLGNLNNSLRLRVRLHR